MLLNTSGVGVRKRNHVTMASRDSFGGDSKQDQLCGASAESATSRNSATTWPTARLHGRVLKESFLGVDAFFCNTTLASSFAKTAICVAKTKPTVWQPRSAHNRLVERVHLRKSNAYRNCCLRQLCALRGRGVSKHAHPTAGMAPDGSCTRSHLLYVFGVNNVYHWRCKLHLHVVDGGRSKPRAARSCC